MSDRFIFDIVDTCAIDRETDETFGIKGAVERLNDSTPNAAIRGLIERITEGEINDQFNSTDYIFGCNAVLIELNKLLEGDNNG